MPAAQPIFVHSLFRSASTYFFHKFRSIESFCCYEEPFNETLAALNHSWRHYRLLASPNASGLRHPQLDRPYFYEFWEARRHLQGLFRKSFAYRHYFVRDGQLPPAQRAWVSAIIEHAPARAVLQFCRSSGRAAALRNLYGGTHVHLWREPRAQWWSYKTADYFDSVSRRIYRSKDLPAALRAVRRMVHIPRSRFRHLEPRENYLVFYGLWLDAWLRLSEHADLSIGIDRIAVHPEENRDCCRRLAKLVGSTIDLSDIRASGMVFAPEEESFYREVEETVNEIFERTGHATKPALQAARAAAEGARQGHAMRVHDVMVEKDLRVAAISLMTHLPHARSARRIRDHVNRLLLRRPTHPTTAEAHGKRPAPV